MADFARRLIRRAVWPKSERFRDAKIVVAHEWFTKIGGSDKVAARLAEILKAEVLFTYALDRELVERLGVETPVVTWRFGEAAARFGRFPLQLFVMPFVWRSLDLPAAKQVVTSSHSCVNAVRARGARRTSYVHTPMRYAWDWRLERERLPRGLRWVMPLAASALRKFDRRWNRQVDVFVANSATVRERIERSYGADAVVVHPPIEVDFWTPGPSLDRCPADLPTFAVAGRLVAYKQPDLAVEAAVRAGRDVVVAGAGPYFGELVAAQIPGVRLVGQPSDIELREVLRSADALLFAGVEDFGMLPVEAQACGTPVIARGAGGALETVIDGVTGMFVDGDDVDVWAQAIDSFVVGQFDPASARAHAEGFDVARFDAEILLLFPTVPALLNSITP
ncbi:MAG: glycosyltransferase involved in cell wall biosynthesis [Candidatus Aldehydirespiratoraceae bacterium]|jgi:glycosyltransferase involved in cell wall biosynthesis